MIRKSNSNPSVKSLREETEALKKEIESLKSEFKRISSALKSHESSFGGHKPHPDTESTQNMAALHVEADRSLNLLGDEYDDLNTICKRH